MSAPPGGPRRRGWGRVVPWGAGLAVLAGVIGVLTVGANRPADPQLLPPGARAPVAGFGEVAFRVGTGPRRCALLADTEAQRRVGLMNRDDLAGYDAMLFRFPQETTVPFYMKDTRLALSIAWFDARGGFVSSADMEPCLDKAECPTYSAARPFRYALEVPRGALGGLGVGPGAHLTVGGACP